MIFLAGGGGHMTQTGLIRILPWDGYMDLGKINALFWLGFQSWQDAVWGLVLAISSDIERT